MGPQRALPRRIMRAAGHRGRGMTQQALQAAAAARTLRRTKTGRAWARSTLMEATAVLIPDACALFRRTATNQHA